MLELMECGCWWFPRTGSILHSRDSTQYGSCSQNSRGYSLQATPWCSEDLPFEPVDPGPTSPNAPHSRSPATAFKFAFRATTHIVHRTQGRPYRYLYASFAHISPGAHKNDGFALHVTAQAACLATSRPRLSPSARVTRETRPGSSCCQVARPAIDPGQRQTSSYGYSSFKRTVDIGFYHELGHAFTSPCHQRCSRPFRAPTNKSQAHQPLGRFLTCPQEQPRNDLS